MVILATKANARMAHPTFSHLDAVCRSPNFSIEIHAFEIYSPIVRLSPSCVNNRTYLAADPSKKRLQSGRARCYAYLHASQRQIKVVCRIGTHESEMAKPWRRGNLGRT